MDGLIRQVVSIDDSQFGFVPGRGTIVVLLFYVHGKHLRSCRDGQFT